MKGVRSFSRYLKKQLKDKKFRQAFKDEEIFVNLAIQIANLRQEGSYSQKDLAKLLHTTQQTVSRLEDPHNKSFSLNTLIRLARVFKKGLRIQFV